jgi:hypothetical protein
LFKHYVYRSLKKAESLDRAGAMRQVDGNHREVEIRDDL